jgi:PAS domain S-box-containing protein
VGVAQDVTADLEATHAGTRGMDRSRQLFDGLPDAAALLDASGRYVRTNRAFQRLVGRTHRELRGRLPIEAGLESGGDEQLREAVARAEYSGREQSFTCAFRAGEGARLRTDARVSTVRIDGARHHLLTVRQVEDVRVQPTPERDGMLLQAVNQELSALNLDRHVAAADLHHLVRTTLSEMLGAAEALELGVYGPVGTQQAARLHDVGQAGGRLLGAIEEGLEWLWPEGRRTPVRDDSQVAAREGD